MEPHTRLHFNSTKPFLQRKSKNLLAFLKSYAVIVWSIQLNSKAFWKLSSSRTHNARRLKSGLWKRKMNSQMDQKKTNGRKLCAGGFWKTKIVCGFKEVALGTPMTEMSDVGGPLNTQQHQCKLLYHYCWWWQRCLCLDVVSLKSKIKKERDN